MVGQAVVQPANRLLDRVRWCQHEPEGLLSIHAPEQPQDFRRGWRSWSCPDPIDRLREFFFAVGRRHKCRTWTASVYLPPELFGLDDPGTLVEAAVKQQEESRFAGV